MNGSQASENIKKVTLEEKVKILEKKVADLEVQIQEQLEIIVSINEQSKKSFIPKNPFLR
jgi:hypothetical protein